jgi:hypothetical protein
MIFKWIVTATAILFGTFFLGPWESAMMKIYGKMGMPSLSDQSYLYNEKMNAFFGTIQALLLMVTNFISIFKPRKKTKYKSMQQRH